MSKPLTATVRMYRFDEELGDCFLVTCDDGAKKSHMLIDCGSFQNAGSSKTRLAAVLADIKATLGGAPLDVVVGTHQHNDHLSGFVHCDSDFRKLGVDQVWLSWLDDPKDPRANAIGKQHHNLTAALHSIHAHIGALPAARRGARPLRVLGDVLGFYGAAGKAPPKIPADAVRRLKTLGKKPPDYLWPGRVIDMPGLPPGSVKVYVLGPPRKEAPKSRKDDPLYRPNPREGESYDHALAAAKSAADKFLDAAKSHRGRTSSEEAQYPFADRLKHRAKGPKPAALRQVIGHYDRRDESWRRIDDDWLNQAETLALFMDSFTNNSSLVLAIELVSSGKVLLFAADAQTGNWASWTDVQWKGGVTTDDLLARIALYKVGHHGSHNATLVAALEKMNRPDLVALIPVHKKDANITKPNGWKMPARQLHRRLVEKAEHRVLQMDGVHTLGCDFRKEPARKSWKKIGIAPKQTDLFIEVVVTDA